jgi:hypothetical protein
MKLDINVVLLGSHLTLTSFLLCVEWYVNDVYVPFVIKSLLLKTGQQLNRVGETLNEKLELGDHYNEVSS